MKAAGIIRKLDQLGRIVLPKSLRKRYDINIGDSMEILVQGEHIILEKYRPRCVFCSSPDDVSVFKEKILCSKCIEELKGFLR